MEERQDLISRQAAIDMLDKYLRMTDIPISYPGIISALTKKLNELQPAPPEQGWIPVAERLLPEDITAAIVTAETKTFKQKYVCEAVWIPRWSKKTEYDCCEGCSEYNEDEDEYYVSEGWYERVHNWDEYSYIHIEDDVIAWMPMPAQYEAEENQ